MSKECKVVFWDVQHGLATYIKTPNNRHIVIDLGTGDYSGNNLKFSPLRYLIDNYKVEQLDYVIITHPHLDHIDDILNFDLLVPKVLSRPKSITNQRMMEGIQEKDRQKIEKYCEINDRYNAPIPESSVDYIYNPENWGGMKIQKFNLDREDNNFNNHSIVVVIEFADIKIVIPGDNEISSLDELMEISNFKTAVQDADILLAPHHGRESGYNNDFVTLVNPRLTVVSDGHIVDTSSNHRYSKKSQGWTVYNSDGTFKERKCLTTNSDGEVFVKFGYNVENERFLNVEIE